MNRLVIILPYFGEFPNYFQLFLNSCAYNNDICDWQIYTDNRREYKYPSNVKVFNRSFDDIVKIIHEKIGEECIVSNPYKLCDYRPAYGKIFEDNIEGYDFWGHCDCDLIFGKMSDFINNEMLEYDKIFRLGHLVFYRNNKNVNERFMLPINGVYRYKQVFSKEENCIFDEANENNELSIDDIWSEYGFSCYINDYLIANTYYKSNDFVLVYQKDRFPFDKEKRKKAIFIWNEGRLIRYCKEKEKIVEKEFLYIHLMRRKMKINITNENKRYAIIPNAFDNVDFIPKNVNELRKMRIKRMNNQYLSTRWINLKKKIKKKFGRK